MTDLDVLIRTATSELINTKELDWLWWHVAPKDIATIVINTIAPLLKGM